MKGLLNQLDGIVAGAKEGKSGVGRVYLVYRYLCMCIYGMYIYCMYMCRCMIQYIHMMCVLYNKLYLLLNTIPIYPTPRVPRLGAKQTREHLGPLLHYPARPREPPHLPALSAQEACLNTPAAHEC
ncbi:hypothetical protein EON63_24880 [archaeon]|nr:MAG: hypothetical protein EON63_24880 [archaeon]